jgi:hypothetical protein
MARICFPKEGGAPQFTGAQCELICGRFGRRASEYFWWGKVQNISKTDLEQLRRNPLVFSFLSHHTPRTTVTALLEARPEKNWNYPAAGCCCSPSTFQGLGLPVNSSSRGRAVRATRAQRHIGGISLSLRSSNTLIL